MILNPINIFQSVGVTVDAVFGVMCRELFLLTFSVLFSHCNTV